MHTYVGDVPLQVHNSCHFLSDTGFINGQFAVCADQLNQVNHELLVGPACLAKTNPCMAFT